MDDPCGWMIRLPAQAIVPCPSSSQTDDHIRLQYKSGHHLIVIIIITFSSIRGCCYEKNNKTKNDKNNNKTHCWLVNVYAIFPTFIAKWCELLFPWYSEEFLCLSEDSSSHQSSSLAPLEAATFTEKHEGLLRHSKVQSKASYTVKVPTRDKFR